MNERIKGELSNKDKIVYKLEGEIAELHSLLQTSKDSHERDMSAIMMDHKRERVNWDNLREGNPS